MSQSKHVGRLKVFLKESACLSRTLCASRTSAILSVAASAVGMIPLYLRLTINIGYRPIPNSGVQLLACMYAVIPSWCLDSKSRYTDEVGLETQYHLDFHLYSTQICLQVMCCRDYDREEKLRKQKQKKHGDSPILCLHFVAGLDAARLPKLK